MCTRDMEPLRDSKYAEECCTALAEAAESPTDVYTVHLARLHGLADRVARTLRQDDFHTAHTLTSAPVGGCVKSLESELQQLKSMFPDGAHQNSRLPNYLPFHD